jgi:hypothetical protein
MDETTIRIKHGPYPQCPSKETRGCAVCCVGLQIEKSRGGRKAEADVLRKALCPRNSEYTWNHMVLSQQTVSVTFCRCIHQLRYRQDMDRRSHEGSSRGTPFPLSTANVDSARPPSPFSFYLVLLSASEVVLQHPKGSTSIVIRSLSSSTPTLVRHSPFFLSRLESQDAA